MCSYANAEGDILYIGVNDDGTREYISIGVIKYPFAVSWDGKYYKRYGLTLQELNGFELHNFLLERAGKTWDAVEVFRYKVVKNNGMTENDNNRYSV